MVGNAFLIAVAASCIATIFFQKILDYGFQKLNPIIGSRKIEGNNSRATIQESKTSSRSALRSSVHFRNQSTGAKSSIRDFIGVIKQARFTLCSG